MTPHVDMKHLKSLKPSTLQLADRLPLAFPKAGIQPRCLLALSLVVGLLGSAVVPANPLMPGLLSEAVAAVSATGFEPQAFKSGVTYGNGVFFAPRQFTVYEKPDKNAPMIASFSWNSGMRGNTVDVSTSQGEQHAVSANQVFFCFYPSLEVAMMAVTGDDDRGWVEVVYDQKNQKTGWVRLKETPEKSATGAKLSSLDNPEPSHFGVYQTWLEFMRMNAKPNGIYWLSGVKEYSRSLRSADQDEAKLIPVTIIRNLKVKHVRGNWLLVEVLDFENNTPLGWVRWRDDEGNLMVFPNLSGKHAPIVTTAY